MKERTKSTLLEALFGTSSATSNGSDDRESEEYSVGCADGSKGSGGKNSDYAEAVTDSFYKAKRKALGFGD